MKYSPPAYAQYLLSLHALPHEEQTKQVKKLVILLLKNGDLKEWRHIIDVYDIIKQKSTGRKKAVIKHALEIHPDKIKEALRDYDVEFVEDAKVLGGIEIKLGDIRIDNTLEGRLAEIKRALT